MHEIATNILDLVSFILVTPEIMDEARVRWLREKVPRIVVYVVGAFVPSVFFSWLASAASLTFGDHSIRQAILIALPFSIAALLLYFGMSKSRSALRGKLSAWLGDADIKKGSFFLGATLFLLSRMLNIAFAFADVR